MSDVRSDAYSAKEPVDYIDPFIGTVALHGKVFPGPATPFGLVQLSPDSVTGGDVGSGYLHNHTTIQGFSFTHMSGVGWFGDLGNLLVMPTTGPLKTNYGQTDQPGTGYLSRKADEMASAGYYAVTLADYGVRAEATAAAHSGILRFTFSGGGWSRIQIDLARRVGGTSTCQEVRVVDDHSIEGWMRCPPAGGGWGNGAGKADYTVYFHAEFSKPLRRFGVWSAAIPEGQSRLREDVESEAYQQRIAQAALLMGCEAKQGEHLGFFTEFEADATESVLLKAGISFVSVEGARANLAAEIPDWDFDGVRRAARAAWSEALAKITVETPDEIQKTVFYTALYRTMIDPRSFADVTGVYPGGDGAPHRADGFTRRTVFSGWDVFRSQFPLQTIINPGLVNDAICSLMELARESGAGYFEKWELLNAYSGCMVGSPALPVLADAYAKGIRRYDAERAYATAEATIAREEDYVKYGYVPGDISTTLENGYADWCMSRLAAWLGKSDDAEAYARRAQAYRNIFDSREGWFRRKDAAGCWMPITVPGRMDQAGCTESNVYQQGWFVPHDVSGLIALEGGQQAFIDDLNSFFEQTTDMHSWNDYYNHANEPVHLVPFLFNRAGAPWLTQRWVREICLRAHFDTPDGLAGDEDVGQMSAWFVLAASGLHQSCPGDTRYEIFSPVFDRTTIRTDPSYASGKPFTIVAKNNSPENVYIQSAALDGIPLNRCWISHEEIVSGGELVLNLGPEPCKTWGLA